MSLWVETGETIAAVADLALTLCRKKCCGYSSGSDAHVQTLKVSLALVFWLTENQTNSNKHTQRIIFLFNLLLSISKYKQILNSSLTSLKFTCLQQMQTELHISDQPPDCSHHYLTNYCMLMLHLVCLVEWTEITSLTLTCSSNWLEWPALWTSTTVRPVQPQLRGQLALRTFTHNLGCGRSIVWSLEMDYFFSTVPLL